MPTAVPIICCSEMYIWKNRSGYASRNFSVKVELPTSPSMATTSGHAPSAASASPNAARVATFMPISYFGRASGRRSRAAAAGRAGRGGVSTRWSLTPPRARTAASATSSFSGLPCQPTASSTSGTPLPLTVRASTTVGSCERAASDRASSICSRSCPSTTTARQPKASTRRRYASRSHSSSVGPACPSRLTSTIAVRLSSS